MNGAHKSFLTELFKQESITKVFIVRGGNSYILSGAKDDLETILNSLKIEFTYFQEFDVNPKINDLEKGLKRFEQYAPNCIIGIGGGSVLDMAKLIRFFSIYKGDFKTNIFERKNLSKTQLICMPTTSGTGAEMTHFSVLYENEMKYSVEHRDMKPDLGIIIPQFTYNNNAYLTACTGFDALAQAIEAYWNINSTTESDQFAFEAIKLLYTNLPLAVNCPTSDIRNQMAKGAHLAGKAIDITKTTAPHAYSYYFTSKHRIPHGHAVAITFPYFAALNMEHFELFKNQTKLRDYQNKIEKLCLFLNISSIDKKSFFSRYISSIGLQPIFSKEIDVFEALCAVNKERLGNNPMFIHERSLKSYIEGLNHLQ
nr:phosphonoacetaldehyde reductase [Porphyromonas macacae]